MNGAAVPKGGWRTDPNADSATGIRGRCPVPDVRGARNN